MGVICPSTTSTIAAHHRNKPSPASSSLSLPLSSSSSSPTNSFTMSQAGNAVAKSGFKAFLDHPAGPRTVFFWAPLMKWCLVAAGLKDLQRPPEQLSLNQNAALALTGAIWVRYSLVITPVNYSLAAVNGFVGLTGVMQLYRIWDWRRGNPGAAAAGVDALANSTKAGADTKQV